MQLTSFRAPAPLEYVSDAATLQDLKKSVATWEHKVKLAEVLWLYRHLIALSLRFRYQMELGSTKKKWTGIYQSSTSSAPVRK